MAPTKHLDLAAKFFVLSVLHRLGLEATFTFSQNDNVDITIVQESGRALTVDVKTLSGSKEWHIAPFRARDHHYVVFVWYPTTTDPRIQPTAYVVASERLRNLLDRRGLRPIGVTGCSGQRTVRARRLARARSGARGLTRISHTLSAADTNRTCSCSSALPSRL